MTLELPYSPYHHRLPVSGVETGGGLATSSGEKDNSIERTVKLNSLGEATVVFTNDELRSHSLIQDYGGSTIRILATVTEDLTDVARNGTAMV